MDYNVMNDGTKVSVNNDGMAKVLLLDFTDGTRVQVKVFDDEQRKFSEILKLAVAAAVQAEKDDLMY
jgi:hypothetical protein